MEIYVRTCGGFSVYCNFFHHKFHFEDINFVPGNKKELNLIELCWLELEKSLAIEFVFMVLMEM